jgi:UDP-N-acetylmuramate--alanine ligase
MDNLEGFVKCFEGIDILIVLPIWSAGEFPVEIDLKGALIKYDPLMADSVTKQDNVVKIIKDGHVISEFNDGIIVAFGAGDITYQIRGENQ